MQRLDTIENFLGVFLFLLGLIVGLVVPVLANPRMGLSSHLEGVMNGMLLIIFGLIWNRLKLSSTWLKLYFARDKMCQLNLVGSWQNCSWQVLLPTANCLLPTYINV
ncbi:MAG: hypothetical protein K0B11_12395 [Mariniphaga sp.]|nr:hypothetical protein [Mariniphaga sp.]